MALTWYGFPARADAPRNTGVPPVLAILEKK
jgi:hypothetical protein